MRSPLARAPTFLPRVKRAVPAEAFGHPQLTAAVEAVYDAQAAASVAPRDPSKVKALQNACTRLATLWQIYAQAQVAGSGSGTSLARSLIGPAGTPSFPASLLGILNAVPVQFDPASGQPFVVPAGAPGSPEAQAVADYGSIVDALYNNALLSGAAKTLAATQTPIATKGNVAANTPQLLYTNGSSVPMAVYVRADSPNLEVSALFLAGAAQLAAIGVAPIAVYSVPFEAIALLLPNSSLYAAVAITGTDLGSIIGCGVPLQGASTVGLGGSF